MSTANTRIYIYILFFIFLMLDSPPLFFAMWSEKVDHAVKIKRPLKHLKRPIRVARAPKGVDLW